MNAPSIEHVIQAGTSQEDVGKAVNDIIASVKKNRKAILVEDKSSGVRFIVAPLNPRLYPDTPSGKNGEKAQIILENSIKPKDTEKH
ncbi:MAG: hypothetical protein ABL867_10770, partial [Rickettsiales bacterium]